jgi:hypothetical protein
LDAEEVKYIYIDGPTAPPSQNSEGIIVLHIDKILLDDSIHLNKTHNIDLVINTGRGESTSCVNLVLAPNMRILNVHFDIS